MARSKQLTAAAVERLRPAAERREVPDGGCPGLYLVVQTSGVKSWAMRFRRPNGKTAKLTLGPVDPTGREHSGEPTIGMPLTLAAARRLATEMHRQRALGRDVVAHVHRERLEREARGSGGFAQAAVDFIERHAKPQRRGWAATASMLGLRADAETGELNIIPKSIADRWRDRPVAEIDADEIHALIDEVRERGVPGLGRRVDGPNESRARMMYAALSKMFSWLLGRRRVAHNPCRGVQRPEKPKKRSHVLTPDEIVKFWRAAEAERVEFAAILKLLLLTGCRRGEVAGMRRSELSDGGATWTIPGSRTKNGLPHLVPLAPLARDVVAGVPTEGDVVFTTDGESQVSGWSKIKRRLDARMGTQPWRLHDLRRTCATRMAEIGVLPHVVEAVLNHVSGFKAGVAGNYNWAAYKPEKKTALERWAAHVKGLVSGRPANVVPMARKKGR